MKPSFKTKKTQKHPSFYLSFLRSIHVRSTLLLVFFMAMMMSYYLSIYLCDVGTIHHLDVLVDHPLGHGLGLLGLGVAQELVEVGEALDAPAS